MLELNSISFENYKCFKGLTTINEIKPINIVIGKNNIGKSSLLDILEICNNPVLLFNNISSPIYIDKKLEDSDIRKIFHPNTSGGWIGGNHYEYGKKFIGENYRFKLVPFKSPYTDGRYEIKTTKGNEYNNPNLIKNDLIMQYWEELASQVNYKTMRVKRIYAERNILPEQETTNMSVDGYGNGITSIINNFLNKEKYDESRVRVELLSKLNEIIGNDANFTEIITQQVEFEKDDVRWEIFLREKEKGRIALSKSGSGLKTILMVLVYTILLPVIEQKSLTDYIFLFEELENNLHPSLERRLLKYIEEIAQQGSTVFLTTHSSTLLDSFQSNDNVQIYHVMKENNNVKIKTLSDMLGKKGCLDDLGIKASDILQSNGIIWVEGPSDRIYINKWIELWSNGKLKEGMNYQCVFYGGRLLSNTTFDMENIDNLINLMNVNKNSIILIDSDKTSQTKKINDTKVRIKTEFESNGQICWITKGKEIENYVPKTIIESFYKKQIGYNFEQYQTIDAFLNLYDSREGERFKRDKIKYAKKYVEKMSIENMKDVLDIDIQMKKVVKEIEKWNEL